MHPGGARKEQRDLEGATEMELIEFNECGLLAEDHRAADISMDDTSVNDIDIDCFFHYFGTNLSAKTSARH